ncbi:MAG: alpha/beta hydrolase-fold protein [Flavobacteriaceae bacterium]
MKKSTLLILIISYLFIFNQKLIGQSKSTAQTTIDTLFSKTLDEYREFWVKLPENYDFNNDQEYPVVFLLDGISLQNSLETVYDNYWGHYLPNMILVGISNRTNRTRDLTTSKVNMRRGSSFKKESGGAENFTKFIENELIPYIDNKYRSLGHRTLIGHSYAGLFTINMLINHKHLFQNYIAIDPSLDWDNQKLLKEAKEKLTSESYKGKSLFVSLAAEQLHIWDEEVTMENIMNDSSEFTLFARSIIEFSNYTKSQKKNGLNFSWKVYNEDLHGTVPLPSIRDGLIFLFEWYQFKSPQKYNNPATPIEELVSLLKKQEQIYSENFGVPTAPMISELLSGYGYMNMQMDQSEKAFMFFQMNIKYNPKNPTAYEAMADFYEFQKDKENTLKYLNKAFNLSGENYYKLKIEAIYKK